MAKKFKLPSPLPKNERERLRKDVHTHIKFTPGNPPTMRISVSDLLELIDLSGPDAYLNFFLATYRNEADVDRYNKRVGERYKLKDLKNRPTLLIGLQKEALVSGEVYDLAVIKPPPDDKMD
jgi:hypothetical protein